MIVLMGFGLAVIVLLVLVILGARKMSKLRLGNRRDTTDSTGRYYPEESQRSTWHDPRNLEEDPYRQTSG